MRKFWFLTGFLLSALAAIAGQEYILSVKVNTLNGLDQPVWSNSFERTLSADDSESFLFQASNGSLTVTLSLHPIGEEELLLIAGSSFQLDAEGSPSLKANLKSISLKKGEKAVYYPLGKNDDTKEGGVLFSMEFVVYPVENENT
jgi:hypothetical protein